MAFTAVHPDVGLLDATQNDIGGGLGWSAIYRVRPRVPLACPACGWGVHAKRSKHKLHYFAHDPGRPPECELSNESWEHHMLKLELATAIRAAGWYAALEVAAEDGSWRADVMATSPDGEQRMAWEAQLSPITVDDIRARTDRYEEAGVAVCWVSPRAEPPRWIGAVPAVRVREPATGEGPWWADDGIAGFDYRAGRWVWQEAPLPQFVRWVLHGQLESCEVLPRYRRVSRLVDERQLVFRRPRWWTSRQSADAQDRHEQMRQRQEAARRLQEELQEQREAEAAARREKEEAAKKAAEEVRRQEEARQQHEEHERRMEKLRAIWAREEAERRERQQLEEAERHAQEEQRLDLQRREAAAAAAWWNRLSPAQTEEFFASVIDRVWREEHVRIWLPDPRAGEADYAFGVPARTYGRGSGLYGVLRPCPQLLYLCPQMPQLRVMVRSPSEAQALVQGGVPADHIIGFDFPEHEQLALC